MNAHQTALTQIDEIIALMLANQSAQCGLAEAEDAELIRLDTLKRRLKNDDAATFAEIDRQYRACLARYAPKPEPQ